MVYEFVEIMIVALFAFATVGFAVVVAANIKIMTSVRRKLKDAEASYEKLRQQKDELTKELYDRVRRAERSADTLRREVNDFVTWRKEQGKLYASGEKPKE